MSKVWIVKRHTEYEGFDIIAVCASGVRAREVLEADQDKARQDGSWMSRLTWTADVHMVDALMTKGEAEAVALSAAQRFLHDNIVELGQGDEVAAYATAELERREPGRWCVIIVRPPAGSQAEFERQGMLDVEERPDYQPAHCVTCPPPEYVYDDSSHTPGCAEDKWARQR